MLVMTGHRHWRTFLHNHKLERPLSNVRENWYQQTAEYFWEKQLPGETLIFVCHRLRQLQLPQFGLLLNCWRVTWISRGRWTAAHRAAFVHEDLAERAAHSYESDARTVYKNKGFLELAHMGFIWKKIFKKQISGLWTLGWAPKRSVPAQNIPSMI